MGDKSRKGGHGPWQRTWETNELGNKSPGGGHSPWHRTWETNELGDKWIGRQIPRRRTQPLTQDLGDKWIGRQMNWKTNRPEADTAPDTRRTHFKIELSTPTVNCLGKKDEERWSDKVSPDSLDQTQVRKNQNLKPKHGVSTSTPNCKRQLRSFPRTQHKGASQQAGHTRKRQNPKQRCCYSADCDTQSCPILTFMTLELPGANVLRGNAIPGSKISTFPKRSTEQFQTRRVTNSFGRNIRIYFQKFSNDSGFHPNMNNQSSLQSRTK